MRGRSPAATLRAWVTLQGRQLGVLVGAGPDRAGNKGQVPGRLRPACRERRRPARAGRAHAVRGRHAAPGRVRRRPGDGGAHRLDRTAAWDHGGAAAAGAAGDRRWRAGQPRPCQRGLSRQRRAVVAAGSWYGRFAADRPLELSGRAIQRLLNATVRRDRHVAGLPQKLLADRDFIRTTLGGRWKGAVVAAAANTGFDYLALLCALRAVGAAPRPSLVLLAYTSAELLALVPFTPGGLGFVEAGLVGTLKLAGVPGTAGADRDAAVPAGRLLVADSRRRRRLPPVPPPLPLG
jgi:Lysylphosphatidylglycerol synthase TM region